MRRVGRMRVTPPRRGATASFERGLILVLAGGLMAAACSSTTPTEGSSGLLSSNVVDEPLSDPGDGALASEVDTEADDQVEEGAAGDSEVDVDEVITVDLPTIPPIALPDVSQLSATGDVVADQLGDLVATGSGIDLVSANCAEEGGLVYSGSSTGSDLFDIGQDGSGQYRNETEDGLVSLVVAADGSGKFYDSQSGGLLTVKVEADGSGEYYREEGPALVTIMANADGSGEYYDSRNRQLLTIKLNSDGSGEYFLDSENGLLTIAAEADGSGQYYHETPGDGIVTLEVRADGSWVLNSVKGSNRRVISVSPNGSGQLNTYGNTSVGLSFDTSGVTLSDQRTLLIEVPEPPRFSVADEFPPLGRLGSLTPPCATVIRFDSGLLFDFGQSTLRDDTRELLAQVVTAIEQVGKPVEIVGHTDSIGSDEANIKLSLRRAEAVAEAMRELGMTVTAEVIGDGESQPVAANETPSGEDDPAGRALNRRVEIVIREDS